MTRRLADVAKYVGVSEATVSRVLNSKPGISDATRAAVLTALDVLGYDRPAKLRGERARLVGLILPELQNPIFPAFAEVAAGDLAKRGFTPVLCTRTANGVGEGDYVDMLLDQHVSGVLFSRRTLRAGRRRPRALSPAARARPAGRAGQRGRRRHRVPAGVGRRRARRRPGVHATCRRSATNASGWCSARATTCRRRASTSATPAPSRRRGGQVDEQLVERTMYSMEGGQAAAARLVKRGVTALICASDVHALGAIRAVRRLGTDGAGRRVGGRLRRLGVHELHRSAADDRTAADRGDGPGRRGAAGRPDRRPDRADRGADVRAGAGGARLDRSRVDPHSGAGRPARRVERDGLTVARVGRRCVDRGRSVPVALAALALDAGRAPFLLPPSGFRG